MKKTITLLTIILLVVFMVGCEDTINPIEPISGDTQSSYTPTTLAKPHAGSYGDIALSGGFQSGHFPTVWNLTECDLVISFTYDGSGLVDELGGAAHAWGEFGVREYGFGDFNPTWDVEGAGVWLATDYHWAANTFDPDPVGAPIQDIDDKLILQKAGGHGEADYNLPAPPPNQWANHRMWFDRDGVDQWQALNPLAVDGGTYNTGATYDIILTLHATSATTGTAFMSINGLDQGFETNGNWQTMELTPAGMTFSGDMAKMQVFYGLYGNGATHSVGFNGITIDGCLGTIMIAGCDTGVDDTEVEGVPVSTYLSELEIGTYKNHGQYVRTVAKYLAGLVEDGYYTDLEKDAIVACAAESDIGK